MTWSEDSVINAYNQIAASYCEAPGEWASTILLDRKPYDRARLDVIAGTALPERKVLDLGCGPGFAARYLADQGLQMIGLDASEEMLRWARARHPDLTFEPRRLSALDLAPGSFGGAIALYALVHLERKHLKPAIEHVAASLAPKAPLLLSFYDGEGQGTVGALPPVTLVRRKEIETLLAEIDLLADVRVEGRRPYPFEEPFFRIFATARRTS